MSTSPAKVFASISRLIASGPRRTNKALIIADNLMNIGDLVLCVRGIELLRATHPAMTIAVWQWNTPSPSVRRALASLPVEVEIERGKSPRALARRYDLMIFAGGQAVRHTVSLPCLTTLLSKIALAKLRGGHVCAIGIGVGPVTRSRRPLWRQLLGLLDYVSVRDADSLRHWQRIIGNVGKGNGYRVPELTADLAFGLAAPAAGDISASKQTHIVVSPCYSRDEARGIALPVLDRLIADIVQATGVSRVVLAAHDSRADQDPVLCAQLAQHYAARGLTVEILASSDIEAYAVAYRNAVAVITNRFHGIVFGMLAGRPVFVLDDGCSKTRAAAERFGLPLVAAETSTSALIRSELQPAARVARGELIARSQRAAASHTRSL